MTCWTRDWTHGVDWVCRWEYCNVCCNLSPSTRNKAWHDLEVGVTGRWHTTYPPLVFSLLQSHMLNAERVGSNYHFKSLWCDLTRVTRKKLFNYRHDTPRLCPVSGQCLMHCDTGQFALWQIGIHDGITILLPGDIFPLAGKSRHGIHI